MKTYKVTVRKAEPGVFLVKADTRQQAARHVAAKLIEAEIATFEDGMELSAAGVKVENAKPEGQSDAFAENGNG